MVVYFYHVTNRPHKECAFSLPVFLTLPFVLNANDSLLPPMCLPPREQSRSRGEPLQPNCLAKGVFPAAFFTFIGALACHEL